MKKTGPFLHIGMNEETEEALARMVDLTGFDEPDITRYAIRQAAQVANWGELEIKTRPFQKGKTTRELVFRLDPRTEQALFKLQLTTRGSASEIGRCCILDQDRAFQERHDLLVS